MLVNGIFILQKRYARTTFKVVVTCRKVFSAEDFLLEGEGSCGGTSICSRLPPIASKWRRPKLVVSSCHRMISTKMPIQAIVFQSSDRFPGVLTFYPCLFYPSDYVWHSRSADASRCAHFSFHFTPSWIRQQISVGKCAHRGA